MKIAHRKKALVRTINWLLQKKKIKINGNQKYNPQHPFPSPRCRVFPVPVIREWQFHRNFWRGQPRELEVGKQCSVIFLHAWVLLIFIDYLHSSISSQPSILSAFGQSYVYGNHSVRSGTFPRLLRRLKNNILTPLEYPKNQKSLQ